MPPDDQRAEREQALCRRLRRFNTRTRRWAAVLTGREELAGSVDADHVIRNSVEHGSGRFTRSEKIYVSAMISIVILERAIRSAGAEEGRRRKREAEAGMPTPCEHPM